MELLSWLYLLKLRSLAMFVSVLQTLFKGFLLILALLIALYLIRTSTDWLARFYLSTIK